MPERTIRRSHKARTLRRVGDEVSTTSGHRGIIREIEVRYKVEHTDSIRIDSPDDCYWYKPNELRALPRRKR